MIRLENLSLQRGGNPLLNDVSLTIHVKQRVGVVGGNGAGKSSLFKLLLNELQPDEGEISIPNGLRIAHMAQEVQVSDRPAIDYVIDGHQDLRRLEKALESAQQQKDDDKVARVLGDIDTIHGYTVPSQAEQLMLGLGFRMDQIHLPTQDFSGGWRMRLNLARAMLMPSDILLLDEPTNHLDLEALVWFQQWLKQYEGTLLLISHDREFLDEVVTHVAHVDQKTIKLYTGHYSDFERQRAEHFAQQQVQFEKQELKRKEMQRFVERFRAKASKAKQAQSRLKALERMETITAAHVDTPFSFQFPCYEKLSDPLITLDEASLGYGDTVVLSGVGVTVHPGQRIGLLGGNGQGKSTVVKSLATEIPLLAGERHDGEHLRIGYFAQHQIESIDEQASPLLHLLRLSPTASEQSLRNFLGSFGFIGDVALGSCENFSGGERARLALAMIAWQKPNLLLLDEPTNHLDLEVRHALTVALQGFDGAVLVVSHDRHLLQNTVDEFWLVQDGRVSSYKDSLSSYEQWIQSKPANDPSAKDQGDAGKTVSSSENKKNRRQQEAEKRKRLQPIKNKVKKLEKELEKRQQQLATIEDQLSDASFYQDESRKEELQALIIQQGELKTQLEEIEEQWLEAQSELEHLEGE